MPAWNPSRSVSWSKARMVLEAGGLELDGRAPDGGVPVSAAEGHVFHGISRRLKLSELGAFDAEEPGSAAEAP